MLLFSEMHAWQGDPSVQQILVFSTPELKEEFYIEMENRFTKEMDGYAGVDPVYVKRKKDELSDSNAGAVFKLRAVKTNDGSYAAIIRCGVTGCLVWEDENKYKIIEDALIACFEQMSKEISNDLLKITYSLIKNKKSTE